MTRPRSTAIENVRVFDGTALSQEQTVVFEGDLITSVSPTAMAAEETVDGRGRVLLPGLIDSHVHIDGRASLEACARWGLTTVLDMAVRDIRTVDALRQVEALPTVLTAGVPASAPGGQHVKKMGFPASSALKDTSHAARFVAEQVASGADFIKVIVEDPKVPGTKALPVEVIAAVVSAAHKAGKLVVAHAVTTVSVRMADEAGVDVITHAPLNADLAPERLANLLSRGVVLIPTLTMMRGVVASVTSGRVFRVLSTVGIAPKLEFAHAQKAVAACRRAGLTILAGTDANTEPLVPARPPYGESLHAELALLVAAGLSPAEALRSATIAPAEVFSLSDRGLVAPGRRADLVLLDGDPIRDITMTRSLRASWIGGVRSWSPG
jgi:Imidazolonepropionase and related amidohydrolases